VLALALTVVLGGTSGSTPRGPSSSISTAAGSAPASGFAGAPLPTPSPARAFALSDPTGRPVRLSAYRGRVVILAFLSASATGASPLIAQQIRGALDDLGTGAAGREVAALAVSADPRGDTPARIDRFLAQVSLAGRLEYLSGPLAALRPIWRAYHVVAVPAGRAAFERAAQVLLIDPRGRERVVFGVEQLTPEGLAHDVRRLLGETG
jgi:protein SCO1/2